MEQSCLMGIDIGTQSTRAALIDLEGNLLIRASTSQDMYTPSPGWAEQDPQNWWHTTIKNIRQIFSEDEFSPDQVIAIGVSGQMHGTVPLGADGEPLADRVQLWCDKRPAELVDGFIARPETTEAYQIAGSPPIASWLGFKILWEKTHRSDLYEKTWKFLLPKDFINFKLTGVPATDHSEASGAFLMDVQTEDWSNELVSMLDLDPDKLPEIFPASQVIGHVSSQAAALTGLRVNTPVVSGGGDMLCMLLAAGITRPGIASDVTGTSSIFSVFSSSVDQESALM